MIKWLESVDRFTKVMAENLERKVSRSTFLKTVLSTAFLSFVSFSARPVFADGSSSWCQIWGYDQSATCNFPNRKACPGCSSSQSSKCPTGYKVSYAHGYESTGCWCLGYSWGSIACCDCTLSGNDSTRPYSSDCGCAVTIR